ncbi:DEAD/DEAH box helicase [Leifsonia sp. PS1209]|uniref:DEAD/DEAH box helicase n=1 Tax=Leifsonia sp. PS1209 TaxID=2724914 RepID=UPI001442CBA1|nr:DEAD/DEAH box helicase [Leifsonia sp. PS1209]QIZ99415.1 DEAD/DEAH box helicase [Leifsonia sp. PS1209]
MSNASSRLDAIRTFEHLRDAYFRYYDTPFGLADQRLQEERRALLDRDGGVYRQPLLELRPEYATTGRTLGESVAAAGADPDLAKFAEIGLLTGVHSLYEHQEQALAAGVERGRNMVITAGTGSGKTESFLLPVLSTMLGESRAWTGRGAVQTDWWTADKGTFQSQRVGEVGREAAVRTIVLYPMNALVDDQLIRLRRALDNDAVRSWLDTNRNGHRFYFGRYTGSTPVTGGRANGQAQSELRRYLRETSQRGARAREVAELKNDDDLQYFVPRLDGAEMRSRWDMIDSPPDVLITNYSMLNVMLLRERDGHFFDSTRKWLDNPENRFTLVVDELHTYRGTAGTEVAYLLRTLKRRLGLESRPDQFRVLAASASLDPARDATYLNEFFDTDRGTFIFISGTSVAPAEYQVPSSVDPAKIATADPKTAANVARDAGVVSALRGVLHGDGAGGAKTLGETSEILFPGAREVGASAIANVLAGLGEDPRPGDPRLRAHLFFRNVVGMWACSDPDCSAIDRPHAGRTVGKLYAEPTTRCTCGARVLELLYCQNCGDVFLGGFAPEGQLQKPSVSTVLLADVPELAKLPDQVSLQRTADNYVVYWPHADSALVSLDSPAWTRDTNAVSYAFRRSRLNPLSGELTNMAEGFTGWSFHARIAKDPKTGALRRTPESVSPFPTQCPNCGDDWEIQFGRNGRLPATDPATQRSPIRQMRTGFEKINQVLTTELANDLGDAERKLIVFTDSRQDAAKLSAGLGLRHYQDLLRQLLYLRLVDAANTAGDLDLARAHVKYAQRTPESFAALKRLAERNASALAELRDVWEGAPDSTTADESRLEASLSAPPSLRELASQVSNDLLRMGINPGGPHASLQQSREKEPVRWSELYDWNSPSLSPKGGLTDPQKSLLQDISQSLEEELLQGLFSGGGRDFESLGLGWLALSTDSGPADRPANEATGQSRAALRILADQRRFFRLRSKRLDPTPKLRKYWSAVASADGSSSDAIRDDVLEKAGAAIVEYLIDPALVVLRPGEGRAWVCVRCSRQSLSTGNGYCTKCGSRLPQDSVPVDVSQDYYAWKATRADGMFRLNTAELTGQTDRVDAQSRQSRFQDVFLGASENELTDGVDLLSVTTTMEAGVDIGALSAVVLGNMPPTRFNYQQRVGRAGRRNSPVAIALTVCRGRSHDEYYFERPDRITNEPTPKPYLALNRREIFARSLRSEVLRQAFAEVISTDAGDDPSSNVHGAFGKTAFWQSHLRPRLNTWLRENGEAVSATARSLASGTSFEGSIDDEVRSLSKSLVSEIDEVVASNRHEDLSQLLAEKGLLPMFGFPTSVRYLYLKRPSRSYPWPPRDVIDRDLSMAVSQFAPMSEVVRDGRVYPVVGITSFSPGGSQPQPHPQPLGTETLLAVCRSCSYLGDRGGTAFSTETCPRCGAGPSFYSTVPLREPLGFRSAPGADFEGSFSWSPRAMAARAMTDMNVLHLEESKGARIYSGPGSRYVINDNGGRLFSLQASARSAPEWGGFVSTRAIEAGIVSRSAVGDDDPIDVALGAVQHTDFLFATSAAPTDSAAGLRLNLVAGKRQPYGAVDATESRRAAWYSLAFLLRTVASAALDIQPLELSAGIYSGLVDGSPSTFAFLADTLENGAGFSTHLGSPEFLPTFLDSVRRYLRDLEDPSHADHCNSSCYRCLRDYGNMAYHALLDWRLARDLFGLLEGEPLTIREDFDRTAIERWASAYGATPIASAVPAALYGHPSQGTFVVIVRHAFEAAEETLIAPRLAEAMAEVEGSEAGLSGIVFVDAFTLDRDPRRVLGLIADSAG